MADPEEGGAFVEEAGTEVREAPPVPADELHEALAALHDLRQFVLQNATQWKMGAGHHNPMWLRVASTLGKHRMNHPDGCNGHGYLLGEPGYYCE